MKFTRTQNTDLISKIKKLADSQVSVGWQGNNTYEDGTPVASVAYDNEFGNRSNHVPMRPFIRQTIHENEKSWIDLTSRLLKSGKSISETMATIGAVICGDIQVKILNWKTPNPTNSPATIERKGFDKPLVDSGLMQRDISYLVKDGSLVYPLGAKK